MIEHFDKIWWPESDLLGWDRQDDRLVLFVDLYMLNDHPQFGHREPADDLSRYYRLAKLIIGGLQKPVELPSEQHAPQWDDERKEYTPVGRIVDARLECDGRKLIVDVSGMRIENSITLETKSQSVDLVFEAF